MRRLFLIVALSICSLTMLKAQNLSISIGAGFGDENKVIEWLPDDQLPLDNRKIVFTKALNLGGGLVIDDHVQFGIEVSYTWAVLKTFPQYNVYGPTINDTGWTSFGGWGKYSFFSRKRLQLGVMASVGIHMGYPKRMNVDKVEKGEAFYAGLHAGPQFKISDHFMIGYYYGRGKYNNSILFAYTL